MPTPPTSPRNSSLCAAIGCAMLGACGRLEFDDIDAAISSEALGPDAFVLSTACPPDVRLLACYDFEGNAGDRTGRGNDAPLAGTAMIVPGLEGQAMRMDASSRADLAGSNLATTRFTIELWIRLDRTDIMQLVFDHDSRWALEVTASAVISCAGPTTSVTGPTRIPAATWAHVACTNDGTVATVFVDGQLDAAGMVDAFPPGDAAAAIGGNAPSSQTPRPFLGTIDRLRIWNAVLSASEVCAAAGRSC